MNKQKALIKNTFILALGKVSTQLVSFLLLPLYTIFLSPSDYGTVDLIVTYVMLLVPIIMIRLETASFRFLVDARQNEREKRSIISNTLWVIIPIMLVCTLLYLALDTFIDIPYSGLILLNICITIFSSLFLQFARGLGDNKKFAMASMVTGLTTLMTTLALVVYANLGAQGVLLSFAIANALCCIYLFFSLKLYHYITLKARDVILRKKLIKYSLPLVSDGVSWWLIDVSDRTIISIFIGVASNGIYAVSSKYAAIAISIFAIFNMSWTESASMHIDGKDRDKFFSETINASIRFFGSLGLVLIALIPLIFSALIDVKYIEAYQYIPILITGAFFSAIANLHGVIYIAKKQTKQIAKTAVMSAILNITLTLLLINFIGIYAAAISTAIAYLAMAIYRYRDVKKYVTISYERNILLKIASLHIFAISLYYMNHIIFNLINLVVIIIIAVLLNKSMTNVIKDKILSLRRRKQKKLTLEQEAYEDSL